MFSRRLGLSLVPAFLALAACKGDKDTQTPGADDTGRPHLTDEDADGYGAEVDCDDTDASVSPGADERCDGIDDDCDGLVDEAGAVDGTLYYPDADGDGYGDLSGGTTGCAQPEGTVADSTDCDDGNAARSPGTAESCDDIDNDCDGEVDEAGATGGLSAHPDADGDGYGDDTLSVLVCVIGDGYVSNNDDCDDGTSDVNPSAEEVCDEVDNDCDGEVDNDATDQRTWYQDSDGDSYGVETDTQLACDKPDGYARAKGDCDDSSNRVYPGNVERCDGLDNDCDDEIDDDAVDADTWYVDTDGDGYGTEDTALTLCDSPGDDYVVLGGDCDEEDAEVNPGVEETWYDGLDEDCDGKSDYDQDGDTYVVAGLEDEDTPTYDPGTGEIVDDGSLTEGGDCDDTDKRVSPGTRERCDDADNDCDGEIDEGAADARSWYTDADGDAYGDDSTAVVTCDAPDDGSVARGGDCDDDDADINPGEIEKCDTDGVDNDCDGEIDECLKFSWNGYFIVGDYGLSTGDWTCVNYYTATGTSSDLLCDACDYSLEVSATYYPDALAGSYDECDWADLDDWSGEYEFTQTWSFASSSARYGSDVAYYYYAGGWYPSTYSYYGGYSSTGYSYLEWISLADYESSTTLEAALFWGYLYAY